MVNSSQHRKLQTGQTATTSVWAAMRQCGGAINENVALSMDRAKPSQHIEPISLGEIKVLIKKPDKTKATSTEDVPIWLSVECVEDICIPIHNMISCMLSTREYPDMWKRAQVVPIPKCKNPAEFKHYRPISLHFHMGKLAEQVIIDKLKSKIAEIIKPARYAYRPNLSTTDALRQYYSPRQTESKVCSECLLGLFQGF